jgi:hypothetical protein
MSRMNVLQVLATTSIGFVLFAVVWVMYVEEWLEQRELDNTGRSGTDREGRTESVEQAHQSDSGD